MVTAGKVDRREEKGPTAFLAAPLEDGLPCLRGNTCILFPPCLTSYGTWLDSLLFVRSPKPLAGVPRPVLLGSMACLLKGSGSLWQSTCRPGASGPAASTYGLPRCKLHIPRHVQAPGPSGIPMRLEIRRHDFCSQMVCGLCVCSSSLLLVVTRGPCNQLRL